MKSIVWLASYPKSGNTWLRAFLANYILDEEKPVPINQIQKIGMSDSHAEAFRIVSKGIFNPNDPVEGARIRQKVLHAIVSNNANINLVKSHCENGSVFGSKLIPTRLTRSAVYVVRNPLDMIVSFASHFDRSIDAAIHSIAKKNNRLKGDGISTYQYIGTWSDHVHSWTKEKKFPVITVKYEDMLDCPHEVFGRVVNHIGLPEDESRLEKAIRFSDFKLLQNQESVMGFSENPAHQRRFFRSGTSGQWKKELTSSQIERIVRDHGPIMKKHGYKV